MNSVYKRADAVMQALEAEDCPGLTAVDKVEFLLAEYQKVKEARARQASLNTRERLLAALAETPWTTLHALADLALEEGDERTGAAWRWLADNRRWPACLRGRGWFWRIAIDGCRQWLDYAEFMPSGLFAGQSHMSCADASPVYDSAAEAFERAALALALRDALPPGMPLDPWRERTRAMKTPPAGRE